MNNFAKRLRELRIEKNLTLEQLAENTNFSYSAIHKWENNLRTPNANAVIELAKFFKVSAGYLLGLED
jgi:transcriptional regulator with XRE-family HTH domain